MSESRSSAVHLSGILPIDKPGGMSSFDVIRGLKRRFAFGKIGHAGTLDPLAEGVLPLMLGEASKTFAYLQGLDKIYRASVRLGVTTDSDDADGNVTSRSSDLPSREAVLAAIPAFTGEIRQTPPKYSAVRVNGRRAYKLARANDDFELAEKTVTVRSVEVESYDEATGLLVVKVVCSSGTYIRSIARDLGEALGCGGHIERLARLQTAGIGIESCVPPEAVTPENIESLVIPLDRALSHIPALESPLDERSVRNGIPIYADRFSAPVPEGVYRLVAGGKLLALTEMKDGRLHYIRVFRDP